MNGPNLCRVQTPLKISLAMMRNNLIAYAELEEITVTAQKRVESPQEVPVVDTALTGETMKTQGIASASDLVGISPGLSAGTQKGSSRCYFLRGVDAKQVKFTVASVDGQVVVPLSFDACTFLSENAGYRLVMSSNISCRYTAKIGLTIITVVTRW